LETGRAAGGFRRLDLDGNINRNARHLLRLYQVLRQNVAGLRGFARSTQTAWTTKQRAVGLAGFSPILVLRLMPLYALCPLPVHSA
jgi:hypothetical protein